MCLCSRYCFLVAGYNALLHAAGGELMGVKELDSHRPDETLACDQRSVNSEKGSLLVRS